MNLGGAVANGVEGQINDAETGFWTAVFSFLIDKVLVWDLTFLVVFYIFYVFLQVIVWMTTFVYLLSILSLVFNIPAFLSKTNNHIFIFGQLKNLSASSIGTGVENNFGQDITLNAFNSIYGWIIYAGIIVMLLFVAIGVVVRLSKNRFKQVNGTKFGQLGFIANLSAGTPNVVFKDIFKGAIYCVVTLLFIGIAYTLLTFASIILTFIMMIVGGLIADAVYGSTSLTWNSSGMNTTNGAYSNDGLTTWHPINAIPTIFGGIFGNGNILSGSINGNYTNVIIPNFFFYELFNAVNFEPMISTNGHWLISPMSPSYQVGTLSLGAFLIGWIRVPVFAVVLGIAWWIGWKTFKLSFQTFNRIFTLVAGFFVIIMLSFYAMLDGGKKWKAESKNMVANFFATIYMVVAYYILAVASYFVLYVGFGIVAKITSLITGAVDGADFGSITGVFVAKTSMVSVPLGSPSASDGTNYLGNIIKKGIDKSIDYVLTGSNQTDIFQMIGNVIIVVFAFAVGRVLYNTIMKSVAIKSSMNTMWEEIKQEAKGSVGSLALGFGAMVGTARFGAGGMRLATSRLSRKSKLWAGRKDLTHKANKNFKKAQQDMKKDWRSADGTKLGYQINGKKYLTNTKALKRNDIANELKLNHRDVMNYNDVTKNLSKKEFKANAKDMMNNQFAEITKNPTYAFLDRSGLNIGAKQLDSWGNLVVNGKKLSESGDNWDSIKTELANSKNGISLNDFMKKTGISEDKFKQALDNQVKGFKTGSALEGFLSDKFIDGKAKFSDISGSAYEELKSIRNGRIMNGEGRNLQSLINYNPATQRQNLNNLEQKINAQSIQSYKDAKRDFADGGRIVRDMIYGIVAYSIFNNSSWASKRHQAVTNGASYNNGMLYNAMNMMNNSASNMSNKMFSKNSKRTSK